MKKEIIIFILAFLTGLIVGIGLFYNEDWNGFRPHLRWERALRDWNPGGDSSLRQCLYYFSPIRKDLATLKEIFCIKIKELKK